MNPLAIHNPGPMPHPRMKNHPRIYGIIHFSLNTFTNLEWGYGDESPTLFNPTCFDADQIAAGCRAGGLEGLVIVCKHHDGFCLWPTRTTAHNVTNSPFSRDLVGELTAALRRAGLKVGFYVSPWDRNDPSYGTPDYLEIYRAQLREVLTNYGEAFEVWFDGANGGDGYYGGAREVRKIDHATYYDWTNTWALVRQLQPNAAIFSDIGPDLRWVGNELGCALPESSARYTPESPDGKPVAPGNVRWQLGTSGHADGDFWLPPECDFPLRPGWFYHASEDNRLRSVHQLIDIYCRSIGAGGYFNIGIAPDRRGRLHENDVKRLAEFKTAVDSLFARPQPLADTEFNLIRLREDGDEKVRGYRVLADGKDVAAGNLIGIERLIRLPRTVKAARVELAADAPATLELFLAPPDLLTAPAEGETIRASHQYRVLSARNAGNGVFTGEFPASEHEFSTFVWTPRANPPHPARCGLELSFDGVHFAAPVEAEFGNICANPIPQLIRFAPGKPRQWRLTVLRTVGGDGDPMPLELGVL
ncbi:MAG: alpha-L-fucosidase [Victivallaceae bacterium]